ncbi:unnamed protein product [Thlaspi arvense]|uniref:Uncharacterized protein n=1 Tax=Thlaspi arvense TaxID=13288 RepID=A0AAU9SSJ8_THLAR|nr:unnamed protein product [Thlaspi arvense]
MVGVFCGWGLVDGLGHGWMSIVCGEWQCGGDGKWEFLIDKEKMSRVVSMGDGIEVRELEDRICREFFVGKCSDVRASLSYWPPNSRELATGITTPPVMVTNAGAVAFFFKHLRVNSAMNMFVTFVKSTDNVPLVADGGLVGFTTPVVGRKRKGIFEGGGRSGRSDEIAGYASSVGSKSQHWFMDDEDVVSHVESAEGQYRSGSIGKGSIGLGDEFDLSDTEENCRSVPDDGQVAEAGYDKDFWEPLIDDPLGGSDAIDILCGDDVTGEPMVIGMMEEALRKSNAGREARAVFGKGNRSNSSVVDVSKAEDVEIPVDILQTTLMPPRTKRPPGRPKEGRIPSTGEIYDVMD